jgi:hypothetical protein
VTYDVVWTPEAESDLAAIWLTAPDPGAISAASHLIDRELGRSPLTCGRPRTSSVNRVATAPPLGVTFEVIEDDKRVLVQAVFTIS